MSLALALLAAVAHALFGALQRARHVPWLARAAIDASGGLTAAPFARFVLPWPAPHIWPIFLGAVAIHLVYEVLQAMTCTRGGFIDRATLVAALELAATAATGAMVAADRTHHAYGIRATADPCTFLARFCMLDGIFFPLLTRRR